MDLQLSGQVAVVTGASKGIGLAVTRTLLEEGARVVATSRGRTRELDALAGDLLHVPADLSEPGAPAKAAMANLTKALSEEFGAQGVRVNSVCPGPVNTPWWTDEGGAADIIAAQPGADRATVMTVEAPAMMALVTGRLAEPQEIADAIVLLASPRSASTTGAEVVVDSGLLKAA